jgi:hypothetical protein
MTRRTAAKKVTGELAALERAAKKAVQKARQTGTPAYVLENDKIVDAARATRRKSKKSA